MVGLTRRAAAIGPAVLMLAALYGLASEQTVTEFPIPTGVPSGRSDAA